MTLAQIGVLLRRARVKAGLTQKDAALKTGVSHRLWSEFERGERPNVSLETALRMLHEVGVIVSYSHGGREEGLTRDRASDANAMEARADVRRRTWTGRKIRLQEDGLSPEAGDTTDVRIAAVASISAFAYEVAGSPKQRGARGRVAERAADSQATGSLGEEPTRVSARPKKRATRRAKTRGT